MRSKSVARRFAQGDFSSKNARLSYTSIVFALY
ncbi:hypothetical protein Bhyg_03882 [Pseudolycoriella hygida]|uniref:Uncharacterized protein n=1 Tax=Pseudolycoriella hygida TaxID=35572 RepID=A0A9Q0NFE4_9DIPT|nr:hypothetical protein Bhyg_03882 [Pseudolycoriella hygida]